ncbi:MAG: transglycosylase domain-containing protein, partial [Bdellovibrionaceae bacterium]|nr:transglycosylase domain-containing protein [Pseudobdellovibrionaceae bacterium]
MAFEDFKEQYQISEAQLLDRHGNRVDEVRLDFRERRLEWTKLDEIAPDLLKMLLYAEDRNFYKHAGVDWTALLSAGIKNLFLDKTRGASTVTMQLASFIEPRLK